LNDAHRTRREPSPTELPQLSRRMDELLADIRSCRTCSQQHPPGLRPVLQASATARLLIVSQAPGRKVEQTGIPFNDVSGERLRDWLRIDRDTFYDAARVAIVPMDFCYPGKGRSGDLPPRPACAAIWHPQLFPLMPRVRLTLAIGQYAQAGLLDSARAATLTDTVRNWRTHLARGVLPLPHPSPRNRPWVLHNPWFEAELLPVLRERVASALAAAD
jgi:uracil-DNA glycosylase